jgi:hypothetical protein
MNQDWAKSEETAAIEYDERPRSHVESVLVESPEIIASVHQAVTELEKRLSAVLRSTPDEAAKLASDPRETLVPLAETIGDHNRQISQVRTRIVSILDRLEL